MFWEKNVVFSYIQVFRAGSISTSWKWKLSPGKLPSLVLGLILKWMFFNILSRKLGKNVNLFYTNMNFVKKSNRKSIMLFKVRDVEIEPGCGN